MQDQEIYSMINLDNIECILKLAKMLALKEYPSTLREVLRLDKYGLPAPLQICFLSLVKNSEECKNCGGTLTVRGVLKSVILTMLETGAQVSLMEQGIEITGDDSSIHGSRIVLHPLQKQKL